MSSEYSERVQRAVWRLRRALFWFFAGAALAALVVLRFWPQKPPALAPAPHPSALVSTPAEVRTDEGVPGRAIVRFDDGQLNAERIGQDLGPNVQETINPDTHDVTIAFSPKTPVDRVVMLLRRDPRVIFAEPDGVYHTFLTPNDPHYDEPYNTSKHGPQVQWYLPRIGAPAAWEKLRTVRSAVRVAIVDTGIDTTHPDLKAVIARDSKGEPVGASFVPQTPSPVDDHGHGTHCAGIAAAETDNGIGVAGVAYRSVQLVPVKVLDQRGSGQWDWIANGITWCADHGCRVISMSLGGPQWSQAIQDAVTYAWSKNCVIVAAAGNTGRNMPGYPAGCHHVVAVSATAPNDSLAGFSSYGNLVAVGAPGEKILATMPSYPCTMTRLGAKQDYDSLNGTSMACPVVSGEVGALLAYQPTLRPQEVIARIEQTADNVGGTPGNGWSERFGHGRVNIGSAIENRPRRTNLGCFYGQLLTRSRVSISGATVRCDGVTVVTGPDGMFRFPNLTTGPHSISFQAGELKGGMTAPIAAGADTDVTIIAGGG